MDCPTRIPVRGDAVGEICRRDRADEERQRELVGPARDPQGVGDTLGVVEGARAEEVIRFRGSATIGEQLGGRRIAMGDQLARPSQPVNSSGNSPQISLSIASSPRRIARRITPSRLKPRWVTTLCAARFVAGISAWMR
jgi:hypothetical protein